MCSTCMKGDSIIKSARVDSTFAAHIKHIKQRQIREQSAARTDVFQVEQLADGGGALGAEAAGLGVIGDAGELSGTLLHNN